MATRGDIIMPTLTGSIVANYKKHFISTSDAGRTLIVSVTKSGSGNVTDTVLEAVIGQLTQAQGVSNPGDKNGPDSFTIAGVGTATGADFASGTTTVVYLKVQGTGTPNLTEVEGATLAKVCEFTPRF
jgi:hypothetical protein